MNKNWSNTALVAYSLLPKIVKEIDFGVKTRVKSGFQSKHLKNGVSNEQLIGEILQLNNEKRKIINLRYIVAEALNKMAECERLILIARIIQKHTFQQISDDFGLSLRTVFRKIDKAEESFASHLRLAGFSEQWLKNEYSDDRYIAPINRRIVEDKYFVAKNL